MGKRTVKLWQAVFKQVLIFSQSFVPVTLDITFQCRQELTLIFYVWSTCHVISSCIWSLLCMTKISYTFLWYIWFMQLLECTHHKNGHWEMQSCKCTVVIWLCTLKLMCEVQFEWWYRQLTRKRSVNYIFSIQHSLTAILNCNIQLSSGSKGVR